MVLVNMGKFNKENLIKIVVIFMFFNNFEMKNLFY